MKPDEHEIGHAANINIQPDGSVFLTFKIMDGKWRKKIIEAWDKDLEIHIVIKDENITNQ